MNKKGQAILAYFALFLLIMILTINLISPLKSIIDGPYTDLNCDSDGLSWYTGLTCISLGFMLPYFVVVLIGLAGVLLIRKQF